MSGGFPALRRGFSALRRGFPALRRGFLALRDGFPALRGGFPALRGGFPALGGGFPALRGGIPALRGGFPTLRRGFPALRVDFLALKGDSHALFVAGLIGAACWTDAGGATTLLEGGVDATVYGEVGLRRGTTFLGPFVGTTAAFGGNLMEYGWFTSTIGYHVDGPLGHRSRLRGSAPQVRHLAHGPRLSLRGQPWSWLRVELAGSAGNGTTSRIYRYAWAKGELARRFHAFRFTRLEAGLGVKVTSLATTSLSMGREWLRGKIIDRQPPFHFDDGDRALSGASVALAVVYEKPD